jgi:hypothetical protein
VKLDVINNIFVELFILTFIGLRRGYISYELASRTVSS